MRDACQPIAMLLMLTLALLADGLMDALGPWGFLLVSGPVLLVAYVLVELPYWLPPKKKRRPRRRNLRRRHDQPRG